MPNIDETVKAWQMEVARRFGAAVRARRKVLSLTAQHLAVRTEEHGYPLTRVAISKIESNSRSGKVDVAEVMVLAQALGIPPVMLLFADLPDGEVEVLPGQRMATDEALLWFTGELPTWIDYRGEPTRLLELTRARVAKEIEFNHARAAIELIGSEDDGPDHEPQYRRALVSLAKIAEEIEQLKAEMAKIPGAIVNTAGDDAR
jgi:transcriptional regulator with XRE-family HTH domain